MEPRGLVESIIRPCALLGLCVSLESALPCAVAILHRLRGPDPNPGFPGWMGWVGTPGLFLALALALLAALARPLARRLEPAGVSQAVPASGVAALVLVLHGTCGLWPALMAALAQSRVATRDLFFWLPFAAPLVQLAVGCALFFSRSPLELWRVALAQRPQR